MPWRDKTLTPGDVADFLGVSVDARIIDATDVATAWAQRRRCLTPPEVLWGEAVSWDGGRRYAALLYQSHAVPSGFPSWEPQTVDDYTSYARAMDHVGADPVIA